MSDSAKNIWDHVKTLPEPLQTVLRRRLTDDSLSTPVRAIAERFKLSEEDSNAFETEATLAVVGLTDISNFKDDLIAEVGLNYETAVRVHRAFENEVLLPLSQEVESLQAAAATSPPALPAAKKEVLYEDEYLRITPTQMVKGPTTYSASKIASIMTPSRLSVFDDFGGFLINAVLFLAGIAGILSFRMGWMIAGLIAGAIGFFNVKNIINSKWWVTVTLANGETLRIERKKKGDIDAIYSALAQIV